MTNPLLRGDQGRDEQHLEDTVATFKWIVLFCVAIGVVLLVMGWAG